MQLRPFTKTKWGELVVLTSDAVWDAAVYDSVLTNDDPWCDAFVG